MTKNQQIWPVGLLCQQINRRLNQEFGLLQVKGEISGWTQAASGHCYFTLKDHQGQLRCAMFYRAAARLNFRPKDGMQVVLRSKLGLYEARGELQMIVEQMQALGQGDLYEQFLQLKARLQQAGLFAAQRKKAIPKYPRAIAVITSLGAAALQDVLSVLQRRVPHIPVYVFNSMVQGDGAAAQLQAALQQVQLHSTNVANPLNIEVVLLVRGGGSIEDLWSFNNEALAQAIANFDLPIISGVGHETDFTIADFVADLRAPTPTAAAELCAIALDELELEVNRLSQRCYMALQHALDNKLQQLDRISFRLSKPQAVLRQQQLALLRWQHRLSACQQRYRQQQQQQLQQLAARLKRAGTQLQQQQWQRQQLQQLQQRLTRALHPALTSCRQSWQQQQQSLVLAQQKFFQQHWQTLSNLEQRLIALDPEKVLARGYAMLFDQQRQAICSVQQVQPQQSLIAKLADGELVVIAK